MYCGGSKACKTRRARHCTCSGRSGTALASREARAARGLSMLTSPSQWATGLSCSAPEPWPDLQHTHVPDSPCLPPLGCLAWIPCRPTLTCQRLHARGRSSRPRLCRDDREVRLLPGAWSCASHGARVCFIVPFPSCYTHILKSFFSWVLNFQGPCQACQATHARMRAVQKLRM